MIGESQFAWDLRSYSQNLKHHMLKKNGICCLSHLTSAIPSNLKFETWRPPTRQNFKTLRRAPSNCNLQHSACQRLRWGAKHSPSTLECILIQRIVLNSSGPSIVLFKVRLDNAGALASTLMGIQVATCQKLRTSRHPSSKIFHSD